MSTLTVPVRPDAHNTSDSIPARSLQQRMDALARANDIRTARAQVKRDMRAGRVTLTELLLEPPEILATAKIYDLLIAVPKYGRVKANTILRTCRVSPSKTVAGITGRQRREIATYLRGR